jgi:hypothetical protein
MKKYRRLITVPLWILLISNLPYISEILAIFIYATVSPPYCFITKDAHFYACGSIKSINEDPYYNLYKHKFPAADHTLNRCNKTRDWRYFFMWRTFLTDENWTAPYIEEPFFIGPAYHNDYDLNFNASPRPYRWNDVTKKWEKTYN